MVINILTSLLYVAHTLNFKAFAHKEDSLYDELPFDPKHADFARVFVVERFPASRVYIALAAAQPILSS